MLTRFMPNGPALRRLSANLERLRVARQLSAYELADIAGIPSSTLSGLKTGRKGLSWANLDKLVEQLDVDVSDLFAPVDLLGHSLGLESTRSQNVVSLGGSDAGTSSVAEEALRTVIDAVVHAVTERLSQTPDGPATPPAHHVRDPLPRRRRRHPKD